VEDFFAMNQSIVPRLRCPHCTGTLGLAVIEKAGEHVREGLLLCDACKVYYPVARSIPVLLVFRTPFHDSFAAKHSAAISKHPGYGPPRWNAESGEESIQETFTEEWTTTSNDDLTFKYTKSDLRDLHRRVWLKWTDKAPSKVERILNVGCGRGVEAEVLADIAPGAEVFGVDLNFSLLQADEELKNHPALHLVIASLFHLPFERASFDLVYSQGVIHHTYSTKAAFDSIRAFVRTGGHLFIWVYALEDDMAAKGPISVVARALRGVEDVVRPVLSRAPKAVRAAVITAGAAVAHPIILTRVWNRDTWRFENTVHGLRDWFTPRFAHRHGVNEVLEWFEEGGYDHCEMQSPTEYRRLFGRRLGGIGVIGQRQAAAQ
jgi:SAM-dependent methyltransferase